MLKNRIKDELLSRLKRHCLPLLMSILIAGSLFYIGKGNRDGITFIAWSTGYISLMILAASLIIGPVNLLIRHNNPVSTWFRRDISITGGILAVIHSVFGLFVHMRGRPWLYFLNKTATGYSIRFDRFGIANYTGLFSALIIILLLVTSNDYMLKRLNPSRWKSIQRLAYLMFIITIIHCYFYRIGNKNLNPVWWFYIPLIVAVLIFQITGLALRVTRKKN